MTIEQMGSLITQFKSVDTSEFPNFYSFDKPLERGLWILWVFKEKFPEQGKKLSAEEIATLIREIKEVSINARSINNAFTRARDKVHIYQEGEFVFEIMKPGKDHLLSLVKAGTVEVFHFQPGKTYTNTRLLADKIFQQLSGEISIVDPYVGLKTLHFLKDFGDIQIRFLTRLSNLRDGEKKQFLLDLETFRREYSHVQFKDYANSDIHDRYVISERHLVILGHSLNSLGNKESFAIQLDKETSGDLRESLLETFNRRWKVSETL